MKTVVYCYNVEGLIEHVEKEQKVRKTNVFYKIGADGEGSFFKITSSTVEKMRFNEKNGEKYTGAKKLFLLAIVPGIPEKYNNISRVWTTLLHLDELHTGSYSR